MNEIEWLESILLRASFPIEVADVGKWFCEWQKQKGTKLLLQFLFSVEYFEIIKPRWFYNILNEITGNWIYSFNLQLFVGIQHISELDFQSLRIFTKSFKDRKNIG